jgi:3-phosphoshikimate 1-carboxyvinyltransferase
MIKKVIPSLLKGTVNVPPSKSDAQRAILAAALSKGTSRIQNPGKSDDVMHMIDIVQQIGAFVNLKNETAIIEITGIDKVSSNIILNCGESGLASRLIPPVMASFGGDFQFIGEGTLNNRNMSFFKSEFPQMGIEVELTDLRFPMKLYGKLKNGNYTVDGSQSSQYISGLLMALPLLDGNSSLTVNNKTSANYIEMTLDTMETFGVWVESVADSYKLVGGQAYKPVNYKVEGDWSAASYWLVAAALGMEISICGLQMKSKQADKKIIDVLLTAGYQLQINDSNINVSGEGKAFDADLSNAPDLFPALAVLAARIEGVSVLHGVNRLFNKESNRAEALVIELSKLGVDISIIENTLRIVGGSKYKGGEVSSHADHRMAMAMAIFGMCGEEPIAIENANVVNKSYPDFWQQLDVLRSS